MIIDKGEPWMFWPSHICDTFPENPGNKLLTGKNNWEIQIRFSLPEILSNERQSIMTLLPHYTSFEIQGEEVHLACTGVSGETHYYRVRFPLEIDREYAFTWRHQGEYGLMCVIDDFQIWNFASAKDPLAAPEEPHVIFGAGNFPKNGFNLNYTELDMKEFRLWADTDLVAYTRFDEIIFDKVVDKAGNCNFIHKI